MEEKKFDKKKASLNVGRKFLNKDLKEIFDEIDEMILEAPGQKELDKFEENLAILEKDPKAYAELFDDKTKGVLVYESMPWILMLFEYVATSFPALRDDINEICGAVIEDFLATAKEGLRPFVLTRFFSIKGKLTLRTTVIQGEFEEDITDDE